jgi:hypothetical protein
LLPPSPELVFDELDGFDADAESPLELLEDPESLLVDVDSLDGLESLELALLALFALERLSVL